MIFLQLLGGAALLNDADPISGPPSQRRRLALLAFLASSPTRRVSRDKLIAYFWPDEHRDNARHFLADSVFILRKHLGKDCILSIGDNLAVNEKVLGCDIFEFREALAAGDLESALALYRGPFLDGFFVTGAPEFGRWVEEERDRIARLHLNALETLARTAEAAGDSGRAAAWWKQLAAHDPFSSRVALRLMEALNAVGDRAGALQHARLHASLVRELLDAEPDAQVVSYAERLSAHPETAQSTSRNPTGGRVEAPRLPVEPAPPGGGSPRYPASGTASSQGAGDPRIESERDELDAVGWCARAQHHFFQLTESGFAEAEECLQHAIDLDPDYGAAYSALAGVTAYRFEIRRDFAVLDRAIELAHRALELSPALPDAYLWLGYASERKHLHAEAEAFCRKAILLAPQLFLPHLFLGTVRLCWGLARQRWELVTLAVKDFARSVELEPLDSAGYLQFAWVYLLNGQYDAARPLLERGATLEEDNRGRVRVSGILVLRGLLHWREREWEAARSCLDRALALYSGSTAIHAPLFRAFAYCGQGEVALQQGEHEAALHWYRRAVEEAELSMPRAGLGYAALRARCGLATSLHRLLMWREAREQFEQAIAILHDPLQIDGQWTPEAWDALAFVDLARYHAVAGEREAMLERLNQAFAAGWGDLPLLSTDVCFARYTADAAMDELAARVHERGRLPTPHLSNDAAGSNPRDAVQPHRLTDPSGASPG